MMPRLSLSRERARHPALLPLRPASHMLDLFLNGRRVHDLLRIPKNQSTGVPSCSCHAEHETSLLPVLVRGKHHLFRLVQPRLPPPGSIAQSKLTLRALAPGVELPSARECGIMVVSQSDLYQPLPLQTRQRNRPKIRSEAG